MAKTLKKFRMNDDRYEDRYSERIRNQGKRSARRIREAARQDALSAWEWETSDE